MLPISRICLILLLLAAGAARAQVLAPDTAVGRRAVSRLEKTRFVALYDSRYSILNHHFCTINGLKLGVEFRNRFRTGAAIYFLSTPVPTRQATPAGADPDAPATLRFRYLAGYAEYVLLENRRWELSSNLQLGLGSAYVRFEDLSGTLDRTPKEFMGVVEPSVAAQFKVFRWGGVGAGAGWRQPFFVPGAIQRELNGPMFYARGKLFLGEFIKVLRFREKIFSQRGLNN